jgi:hypothetical protein
MVTKHSLLGSKLPLNATHLCTSIDYGAIMAFVFSVDKTKLDINEVKKVNLGEESSRQKKYITEK